MSDIPLPGEETQPRSRWRVLLRPWVLISLTVVMFLVAAPLVYRSTRFTGIPPIGEEVSKSDQPPELESEENAFTFYQAAWDRMPQDLYDRHIDEAADAVLVDGAAGVPDTVAGLLETHREMLNEWKRGTELNSGVDPEPARAFWFSDSHARNSRPITWLAAIRAAKSLEEGKAGEAWSWLRALLRYSRHIGQHATLYERQVGIWFHAIACDQVAAWATHTNVDERLLRQALKELRELDQLTPSNSSVYRSEYRSTMKLLSSQAELLEFCNVRLLQRPILDGVPVPLQRSYLFVHGEPELTQLLLRHVFANVLTQVDRPRWERTLAGTRVDLFTPTGKEKPSLMNPADLDQAVRRSKLARRLAPSLYSLTAMDQERATQSILETCMAVELFRRRHDEYPQSLANLIPEFVSEIPRDPFGSTSSDRLLMLHREAGEDVSLDEKSLRPGVIIYSVGENGIDDGGLFSRYRDICLRLPAAVE